MSHVTVLAADHGWRPRSADAWWLDVVWRFDNPEERPLHVLAEGPLSMRIGDPLVINHTLSDQPEIDPNVMPEMAFIAVESRGSLDLRRSYPLPPVEPAQAVVGRFSASHEPPDPEWLDGRIWQAVERWQTILESPAFRVSPPAH